MNKNHCEHEYADQTWRCSKCGYEIHPDLLGKIAETSSGKIGNTTVYQDTNKLPGRTTRVPLKRWLERKA